MGVATALTIPFTVGAGQIVGQGNNPELWVLYSLDDATEPTPFWLNATTDVREVSFQRGRQQDRAEFEAGTCDITLNNRSRTYDPINNASIRPLNRWWVRSQFSGVTEDHFKGYADSYDQEWPDPVADAVAVARCVDELALLNLDALPVTDPPRDTYGDVVEFETPDGYWPCSSDAAAVFKIQAQEGGKDLIFDGTVGGSAFGSSTFTPIIGEVGGEIELDNGAIAATDVLVTGDPSVVQGINEFAVGFWFQYSAAALGTKQIISGPLDGGGLLTYDVQLTAAGALTVRARNNGGTTVTATSSNLLVNTWYHVVATIQGGSLRVYLNGAQSASTAFTPPFVNSLSATAKFKLGDTTATTQIFHYTQIFTDRTGMTAARVLAQYNAGLFRGFRAEKAGLRIYNVLDSVSNQAPRNFAPSIGSWNIIPAYMHGQPPLEEMQKAVQGEAVSPMLFVDGLGQINFRPTSANGVVALTLGESAASDETQYTEIDADYSSAFITNEWNGSRPTGTLQTQSDAASISAYKKRSQSLGEIPVTTDGDVTTILTNLLAATKDPRYRIIQVTTLAREWVTNSTTAILGVDIGSTVTVKRRPPGGGTITTTSLVQGVQGSLTPYGPWSFTYAIATPAPNAS